MLTDPEAPLDLLPLPLSEDVTEEYIDCTESCGLTFHILKAGDPKNPLLLFCHGFPELAFSWRKVIPAIAKAGYFCVAPDQRGYGRTTGWPRAKYEDVDLSQYLPTNLVRDLICLVCKLGFTSVHCIIGHDFGALISTMAALIRPDFFRSTIQLSHPYKAAIAPSLGESPSTPKIDIVAELKQLNPPRKPYKWYNSSPEATHDWDHPPQGLEPFLRGYFHLKSADWNRNDPHPLKDWSAEAIQVMPEYYVMRLEDSMPDVVVRNMQGEDQAKTSSWLPEEDLHIYCGEWRRTGFQGALNWYRTQTAENIPSALHDGYLFAGKKIEVPIKFISGVKDWGNYQQPGALNVYDDKGGKFIKTGCSRGISLIEGAGHWVQQERPDAVIEKIMEFLETL